MIDKSTILNFVYRIVSTANPDKIYLFGSYATGQANENSDIDLLVIKDTSEPRYKRSIEIQKLFIGSKIPADILVYTNNEFEQEKTNQFSFINSVIQGAQLMYERK
ncbi:MAG: nucleotidyltransferase domain-containing protein [Bacteroidales bacterium]